MSTRAHNKWAGAATSSRIVSKVTIVGVIEADEFTFGRSV